MGVVARSQYLEEIDLLRHKIDELSTNTVILIARAEKLIQESDALSSRLKSLEDAGTKANYALLNALV